MNDASGNRSARVAETVMRALPGWFGLEEPLHGYASQAREFPTFAASMDGKDVGFLTLKPQTAVASEITAMGVLPDLHRQGIGRALVDAASASARLDGHTLLQVKTLGPSHPSEHYARTRRFYEACGFAPLEETTAFWGRENPCLILVRTLS